MRTLGWILLAIFLIASAVFSKYENLSEYGAIGTVVFLMVVSLPVAAFTIMMIALTKPKAPARKIPQGTEIVSPSESHPRSRKQVIFARARTLAIVLSIFPAGILSIAHAVENWPRMPQRATCVVNEIKKETQFKNGLREKIDKQWQESENEYIRQRTALEKLQSEAKRNKDFEKSSQIQLELLELGLLATPHREKPSGFGKQLRWQDELEKCQYHLSEFKSERTKITSLSAALFVAFPIAVFVAFALGKLGFQVILRLYHWVAAIDYSQ